MCRPTKTSLKLVTDARNLQNALRDLAQVTIRVRPWLGFRLGLRLTFRVRSGPEICKLRTRSLRIAQIGKSRATLPLWLAGRSSSRPPPAAASRPRLSGRRSSTGNMSDINSSVGFSSTTNEPLTRSVAPVYNCTASHHNGRFISISAHAGEINWQEAQLPQR